MRGPISVLKERAGSDPEHRVGVAAGGVRTSRRAQLKLNSVRQ